MPILQILPKFTSLLPHTLIKKNRCYSSVEHSFCFSNLFDCEQYFSSSIFLWLHKGRPSQLTSVNDPLPSTLLVRDAAQAEYGSHYNGHLQWVVNREENPLAECLQKPVLFGKRTGDRQPVWVLISSRSSCCKISLFSTKLGRELTAGQKQLVEPDERPWLQERLFLWVF